MVFDIFKSALHDEKKKKRIFDHRSPFTFRAPYNNLEDL